MAARIVPINRKVRQRMLDKTMQFDMFMDLVKSLATRADEYNREINQVLQALYEGENTIEEAQHAIQAETEVFVRKLTLTLGYVLKCN